MMNTSVASARAVFVRDAQQRLGGDARRLQLRHDVDGEGRDDEDRDQVPHHRVRVPEAHEVGDRELAEVAERPRDEDGRQGEAHHRAPEEREGRRNALGVGQTHHTDDGAAAGQRRHDRHRVHDRADAPSRHPVLVAGAQDPLRHRDADADAGGEVDADQDALEEHQASPRSSSAAASGAASARSGPGASRSVTPQDGDEGQRRRHQHQRGDEPAEDGHAARFDGAPLGDERKRGEGDQEDEGRTLSAPQWEEGFHDGYGAGCGWMAQRGSAPEAPAEPAVRLPCGAYPVALFADDTVAVGIPHERVRRVAAADRGDAVTPRLRARNHPVSIVVPEPQGVRQPRLPRRSLRCTRGLTGLLTHDAVAISIPHERVGWMVPRHRGDSVAPSLRARDGPAPVVVPQPQGVGRGHGPLHRIGPIATADVQFGGRAAGQNRFQRLRFSRVDGKAPAPPDCHHTCGKPAPVSLGHPFGGIARALEPRFNPGLASVRLSRSRANARRVSGPAAQSPESWASLRATMCSMSVSPVEAKRWPV